MLKILTYINTAALVAAVAGGAFVYMKRADYVNNMIYTIQDQVIKNIEYSIKTKALPKQTGSVLPF
tara:strand:- start:22 stop:219 length:198 start_codon:yes stop_codon:yes gene_type:complete